MTVPLAESLDHLEAARVRTARLGEHWAQGPTVATTEALVAPSDYARWLREAHAAYIRAPEPRESLRPCATARGFTDDAPLPWPGGVSSPASRRGRRVR